MAKKATIAQETQPSEKKGTRITPMGLALLCFVTSQQYEKATPDELACKAEFSAPVVESLLNYKDPKTGEPSPLLQVDENGKLTATPFGVRWVLQSTQFGTNFNRLFENMSVPALHSAFLVLAKRLSEAHQTVPIHYKTKDGEKNPFYAIFLEAVNMVDECLENQPE